MVVSENAGNRRRDGQSLADRLREIKGEEGWIDVADLIRDRLSKRDK